MTRAQIFLDQLYDEGCISDISFFAIMDNNNWDPLNRAETWFTSKARTFGKSGERTFEDALKIIKFMMQDGVFEVHFYGNFAADGLTINFKKNHGKFSPKNALSKLLSFWKKRIEQINHPDWPVVKIKTFSEFEEIIRFMYVNAPELFVGNLADIEKRTFDIMLGKVKKGSDAPQATPDIERLFYSSEI